MISMSAETLGGISSMILDVVDRHQHPGDPSAMGGKHLLLEPPDRQNSTTERDLAGHRGVRTNRDSRERAHHRRGPHGDAGRGAIGTKRVAWVVDVEIRGLVKVRLQAQRLGSRPNSR